MPSEPTSAPLYSAFRDDPDMMEIVELFVCELGERVDALRTAFDRAAWDELGSIAHQLKGAAGGYGFESVTHAAAALEATLNAASDDTDAIKGELDTLTSLCERVRV